MEDPVEERLVAVLERHHRDVALQVVGLTSERVHHPQDLQVLIDDPRGEEASQAERLPLRIGEGGALVANGIVEKLDPSGKVRRDRATHVRHTVCGLHGRGLVRCT